MSLLRNQTAREISETMTRIVRKWDNLSEKEKKSGLFIDPDKAIVVSAELTTIQDAKADVDSRIHLSVIGIGGGASVDDKGNQSGHDGLELTLSNQESS
mgnify:FL=1|jgi:hypothetical protein